MTWLRGVGRLAPGSSAAAVAGELDARYGETDFELGVLPRRRLDAMAGLVADVNGEREVERQVRLFLAGSVLLALVAACNVSLSSCSLRSASTARSVTSSARAGREFAIRAALGAGPRALGRLVLARGFALALPGLVLGSLLAFVAAAWLRGGFISADLPAAGVALAVAAGLAALVLAASIGPARRARCVHAGPCCARTSGES